jgi:hypothetical protein
MQSLSIHIVATLHICHQECSEAISCCVYCRIKEKKYISKFLQTHEVNIAAHLSIARQYTIINGGYKGDSCFDRL